MLVTADLHIHSPYSIAVSRFMQPEQLIRGCVTKGITVLGTGDALQPDWLNGWKLFLENNAGLIIVPQGEIEDEKRVHHVILAEDPAQFDQLRDLLKGTCKSFVTAGRPHVYLSGEEIANAAHDVGGLVGPAHAFTPWTAMYAYFDSVPACYGSAKIDFLELGLSADSSYGAAIPDLYNVPFLTNSDAHSPYPDKLGREFNRIRIGNTTAKDVLAAIRASAIEMNAGFFPEEGKYNRTACTRCYAQYSLEDAIRHQWRCPAGQRSLLTGARYGLVHPMSASSLLPRSSRPWRAHRPPIRKSAKRSMETSSKHSATRLRCSLMCPLPRSGLSTRKWPTR
jgi:uncharacterized protein (TIGR00375 family)